MADETELLPGADLVSKGIADLESGKRTVEALLVCIAEPRLRWLGIELPALPELVDPAETALYLMLAEAHGGDAHSRYNALIRRLVSYEHALELERSATAS